MKDGRWQEIEWLYHSVLERQPEERTAYLDAACNDESLRKEVESLLACQPGAEGFISSPAIEAAAWELARDQSGELSAALAGRTLSHYRIIERLGAGGMGIVYKALDTRLNRPVALKVLPPERVLDPERKRRFAKEARAASALNHPNIVTIYNIDQVEGVDFIAMEFIVGKSLDELIPRSGMRISQALKVAIQVAEGLSRAHSAGIVHRDLKPSNIMVTDEGLVKILDFGLAKLTEPGSSNEFAPDQPASMSAETERGTITGTPAYMSPEQAEGRPIDARSDIFAFGSVLYEMLTGRRAFQGDNFASTLAAVVKEDPKPASQLASDISPGLERAIQRCLRKEVARRWQHIDDVKIELEELKQESDSQSESAEHPVVRRRRKWIWATLAGAVLAGAGLWLWLALQGSGLPAPKVVPLTTLRGIESFPSLSPDGNQVAFTWNGEKGDNWDIYVKAVGEPYASRLTTDAAVDTRPAWSPDGRHIAFVHIAVETGGIYLISPFGGLARKLTSQPGWTLHSWTPDGKWLAVQRDRLPTPTPKDASGIYLIPVEGGAPRRITAPKAPLDDRFPAVSPNSQFIAFARCPTLVVCDLYCQQIGGDGSPLGTCLISGLPMPTDPSRPS